jgi:hypothetical protein
MIDLTTIRAEMRAASEACVGEGGHNYSTVSSATIARFKNIAFPREILAILDRLDRLEEGMERIRDWPDLYRKSIFRPIDTDAVHALLVANGWTLDGVSAHIARGMFAPMAEFARETLEGA